MTSSNSYKILLVLLSFSVVIMSCRKKDRKFEGTYNGSETYTYTPFGDTAIVDTTYAQTFEVTYDNGWYTVMRSDTSFGLLEPRFLHRDVKKGPITKYSENESDDRIWGSSIKLGGDSLTINSYESVNGNVERWEMSGLK